MLKETQHRSAVFAARGARTRTIASAASAAPDLIETVDILHWNFILFVDHWIFLGCAIVVLLLCTKIAKRLSC